VQPLQSNRFQLGSLYKSFKDVDVFLILVCAVGVGDIGSHGHASVPALRRSDAGARVSSPCAVHSRDALAEEEGPRYGPVLSER